MTATGSTILDIYDALRAVNVTYLDKSGRSVTPRCYNQDEIPNSIETAHLPCRLLFPIGQTRGGGMNVTLGPGSMVTATYQIVDLFLLDTVARERGPFVQSPVMLRYCKAYADAIANKFQWLYQWQTEAITPSVTIVPGVYPYPVGGTVEFYGVLCTISISEIF